MIDYNAFNEMIKRAGVKPHLVETAMKFVKEYEAAKTKQTEVDATNFDKWYSLAKYSDPSPREIWEAALQSRGD